MLIGKHVLIIYKDFTSNEDEKLLLFAVTL